MASRKEIESQIAALQKDLEGADDDTELWVEHERGGKNVRTKLSGTHAKSWLSDLFGPAATSDDDGADDEPDDDVKPDKAPEGGYFAKRKG